MQAEYVNILLVSPSDATLREVRGQLQCTSGVSCEISHCSDLAACLERLQDEALRVDMVFLDLDLLEEQEPEEVFREIRAVSDSIPIIVFTREKDRELALYIAQEGAADNVITNSGQCRIDPNRLRDAIEFSWTRYKQARARNEAVNRLLREKDQVISWVTGDYSMESSHRGKKEK